MSAVYDADVIVVGSGAIGANVANVLAKKGKSVLILEAGRHVPRWKLVENFRNSARKYDFNDPYPNLPYAPTSFTDNYVENTGSFDMRAQWVKLVGGTTWHWGGASWRLLPVDMKLRSTYGVGRDWPISYEDLEPHYHEAEVEMGVAGSDLEDQSGQGGRAFPPRSRPYPVAQEAEPYLLRRFRERMEPHGYRITHEPNARTPVPYDGRPACQGNNSCSPICPIGALYTGRVTVDHAIGHGARLVSEAVVHKIERGEKGRIAALFYRKPNGEDVRVTAKAFVIAAHAMETAKLLLMNDVANSSGQVGRNLMDHIGVNLQFLAGEPLWMGRGQAHVGAIANWRDGAFRSQHSALRHGIYNPNPRLAITQRLLGEGLMGKELDDKIADQSARWAQVHTFFETLPSATNRVQPSKQRDALGLPMLTIHYDVQDYVKKARQVALSHFDDVLRHMNGTLVQITPYVSHSHMMGTTIMGADARDSVVDGDGRSFDHTNLFVASCGVMPAVGVVNPTLTGVAMGIRTAHAISREV